MLQLFHPVNPAALPSVSFRINADSSLLEARVRGRPGWLLACHEQWGLRMGTQLCRHLGALRWAGTGGGELSGAGGGCSHLGTFLAMGQGGCRGRNHSWDGSWDGSCRMTQQKGVNLTDVKLKDTQEFIQVRPGHEGSLEDLWEVRYGQSQATAGFAGGTKTPFQA